MKIRIAVDVDGVLADQVSLILSKLNKTYNIQISNEEIVEWDFPIMETRIDIEIEKALLDPKHVMNLPLIEGAKKGLSYLWQNHHVIIATSRPKETESATMKWLSSNFKFHEYINTRGKSKKTVDASILIDDNIENIKEFSENSGIGLLFSQPWNRDDCKIKELNQKGKVYCCENWQDVVKIVKEFERAKTLDV